MMTFALVLCAYADTDTDTDKAEESKKISIGIGPEWNMNSRENFALGGVFTFNINFASIFAAGINVTVSYNFSSIIVIEPAALFRWYFLGSNYNGWFLQTDLGAFLVLEEEHIVPVFTGSLKGGIRLPFGETFFIEPYGRIGYPFMFGIGVLAGVKF